MTYFAIIVAAGSGKRMGGGLPKQYLRLNEQTILEHAITPFLTHAKIEKVMVVLADNDAYWPTLSIAEHPKILTTVGGAERYQSVLNGLRALKANAQDWILVHDAARALISAAEIDALINGVGEHAVGGLLGMPIASTVKQVEFVGTDCICPQVMKTIPRQHLWQAATPQLFRYGLLQQALQAATIENVPTDCSQAIENLGYNPLMIAGKETNFKITTPADLALARQIMRERS